MTLLGSHILRLNKIGKNPNLLGPRDTQDPDGKTVNEYVSAIATKESVDSFDMSAPRYFGYEVKQLVFVH